MGWTAGFDGLRCVACGTETAPSADRTRCPDCGGTLEVAVDLSAADWPADDVARSDMWRFDDLLPVAPVQGDLRAGGTPLVDAPALAETAGLDRVLVKDEARNPTGSVWDRDLAVAGRAAVELGAGTIALPAAGAAGQAAAAAGARAGLDVAAYVPSRANFTAKATINVAGGDMTVVSGRYADARAAFADAATDADWYPVEAGVNPFLGAGRRTLYWEVLTALDAAPDAVVVPTATGGGLAALVSAARIARTLGVTDKLPLVLAVQPAGCAPIVEALEQGASAPVAVAQPDTICGELEVAEPAAGEAAIQALQGADGDGVAVPDEALYRAALALARSDGIVPSLAGGAAAAGLCTDGAPAVEGTAVVINPSAGLADADRLRSYLMSQGE